MRITSILAAILLFAIFSCSKSDGVNAIVIRNCTGTYLRIGNQEFHVCNIEKTKAFKDSANVTVKINHISDCDSKEIVCFMLYPSDGWVKVEKIK